MGQLDLPHLEGKNARYDGRTNFVKKPIQWIAVVLFTVVLAFSQAQTQDDTELAKKTQNPVADLISVPRQSNFNFGAGFKHNKMIYVLNIQPVIPIKVSAEWNLITRVIMPIINQPSLFLGIDSVTGLGDLNPTFFLSPAKPGGVIWGAGSTFTMPTASDRLLGSGNWSAGPAAAWRWQCRGRGCSAR